LFSKPGLLAKRIKERRSFKRSGLKQKTIKQPPAKGGCFIGATKGPVQQTWIVR